MKKETVRKVTKVVFPSYENCDIKVQQIGSVGPAISIQVANKETHHTLVVNTTIDVVGMLIRALENRRII